MSHKNEKAATEKISRKSVQTNAAESSQKQPTSRPDGTTSEIASDVAGTEATTIKSQSIAAAETPVAMPVLAIAPCGTNVPYVFRETNYEPPDEVKTEEVRLLSHDDLLTGLKRQYDFTRQSHMGFRHDLTKLVQFYDAVVDRFKDQYVAGDKRDGKPRLRESFYAIGWNYDAARKMRQRFNTNALPDHASPPKPLQLTEGDVVKTNDGDKGVVTHVHESAPKVDVVFEGDTEAVTESTKGLIKVKPSVRKVKIGDLFLFEDKQAEYVYKGDGKFSRTETPTLILQKRYADAAKLQAKKDRQDAAAAEKAKEKERRQAEAQRRTQEKMMKRAEDARRALEK